jgi:Secretion system C-terminal sorting domain
VATNTTTCGTSTVTQIIRIDANELTASASPANVSTGGSSTLAVSGGTGTYQWYANSGNGEVLIGTTTSTTLTVTPTRTTQYTVRGTTAAGSCVDEAITRVTLNGNTLPVTLTRFSATAKPAGVLLTWVTATELTNAYFEVQRSSDGQSFSTLTRVQGSGTTSTGAAYSYSDTRPLAAHMYYRLRQVDMDGTSSFSSIVTVSGRLVASFYPNPSNTSITLPSTPQAMQYRVYSTTGHTLLAGNAQGGSTLDIQCIPAGLYFLEINTSGQHSVQRFVRQ